MDLIKIGKYIAGKRKSLGMTQKQLAEKLGMSEEFACRMYLFIKNFVQFLVLASMSFWLEKI